MLIVVAVIVVVCLLILMSSVFTVEQQSVKIIERFGRFKVIAKAGLRYKIPFADRIAGVLDLRIQQLDVEVETKTKDNVFVKVQNSVQYYVIVDDDEDVFQAFYKLSDPRRQITSFVFDVVRAKVPQMILDDVFERKDDVADAVKKELSEVMKNFGYGILKTLVTDIDPDKKVKDAMNDINAAQREQVAANARGEADKILKIKAAEAEAQSKLLQGEGIANQRKAIIEGFQDSIENFVSKVPDSTAKEVMNLVLITQYFDTLKDVGTSSNSNTIFLNSAPGTIATIEEQMRNAVMTGNLATKGK